MTKKLFVGNLAYAMTDDQLSQIFSAHGNVVSANIIKDRFSGRSKGFGFVEFETEAEAEAAMKALDGTDQDGRNMVVKEATPRPENDAPLMGSAPEDESMAAEAPMSEEAVAPVEEVAEPTPVAEEAPAEAASETEAPVAPMEEVSEEKAEEPTEE